VSGPIYRQPSGAVAARAGQPDSQPYPLAVSSDLILANRLGPVSQQRVQPVKTQRVCDNVLGPVPEVDVMAKRPQGLLNVGTLSARMVVLRSCALDI
jgi:hypothetical protein